MNFIKWLEKNKKKTFYDTNEHSALCIYFNETCTKHKKHYLYKDYIISPCGNNFCICAEIDELFREADKRLSNTLQMHDKYKYNGSLLLKIIKNIKSKKEVKGNEI